MTIVVVLVDPPRAGLVLPAIAATTPLDSEEAADLYVGMASDVLHAAAAAGGDLLVNYRTEATISGGGGDDAHTGNTDANDGDAEAAVRALAEAALDAPEEARYERQVGSTRAARVGNTVTHLLDAEDATAVLVVDATTPFVTRADLDGMTMKLRRSPVVLAPATRGRVAYTGFGQTLDFTDADTPPAIGTLTDRALDADHEVDYAPMQPVVETGSDLQTALAVLDARRRAGRNYPERTAAVLHELGVTLVAEDDDLVLSKT